MSRRPIIYVKETHQQYQGNASYMSRKRIIHVKQSPSYMSRKTIIRVKESLHACQGNPPYM